jgi:hypothetical protein
MSRKLVALVLALGLIGAAPAVVPASTPADGPRIALAAKGCSRGYAPARIGGESKCLRRGQFCAKRYDSQYRRHGFQCTKRDARGNYHLT